MVAEVKEQVSISRFVAEKQIIVVLKAQRSPGFGKLTVNFSPPTTFTKYTNSHLPKERLAGC